MNFSTHEMSFLIGPQNLMPTKLSEFTVLFSYIHPFINQADELMSKASVLTGKFYEGLSSEGFL